MTNVPDIVPVGHGVPIEDIYGYSGAVRVGELVHVSGQLSRDTRGEQVPGDLARKVEVTYGNMKGLLDQLDVPLTSVIQVRVHMTGSAEAALDVLEPIHKRLFSQSKPAATIIQVAGLNDPDGPVEISAVAASGTTEWEVRQTNTSADSWDQTKQGARAMTNVQAVESNRPYAQRVGMSEGVRLGDWMFVSGQMALDEDGTLLHRDSCDAQFARALDNVDQILRSLGSRISRVVALECFLTAKPSEAEYGRMCEAHRSRMTETRPTGTMVRVAGLPVEGALVCIAAVALGE